MTTYRIAGDLINNVAAEVGLTPVADPYATSDKSFIQLRYLLDTAGSELLSVFNWQQLIKEHEIVTADGDSGNYSLPADFGRMIDQSGWDYTGQNPLSGPLTDAQWKMTQANNMIGPIYMSFRIAQNQFQVLPQPPDAGKTIKFEYISSNWVNVEGSGTSYAEKCVQASDVPMFEGILIQKLLKLRWLQAKGFDTTSAVAEFASQYDAWTGNNRSAPIISLDGKTRPQLLGILNIPEIGYGS